MAKSPINLYWDSCVFIKYLTGDDGSPYFDDICQLVEDARRNRVKIHFSTISFTEIRPRHLKEGGVGSISGMLESLGSSFIPIEPTPDILIWAGHLKDAQAVNPSDPREPPEKTRVIGTPDAIHLASCIYARDAMRVKDIVFQTLDEGKGASWEGKCIPLLGFERWYPESSRTYHVNLVCGLQRSKPLLSQPNLEGLISRARKTDVGPNDSVASD